MASVPLLVYVTAPSRAVAIRLQKLLLAKKLAASVQISGPVHSAYWWKGKVANAKEWVCGIRSTSGHYAKLERLIVDNHPYETPEIFAIPIKRGYAPYLNWMKATGQ